MANITVSAGGKFTISAANTYFLSAGTDRVVSTYALHLVSNSFVGSITVKSRLQTPDAQNDNVVPLPIPYLSVAPNNTVGTAAYITDALTTTSLIVVPASGQQIVLDCTAYTSGSMTVYAVPLLGAGA